MVKYAENIRLHDSEIGSSPYAGVFSYESEVIKHEFVKNSGDSSCLSTSLSFSLNSSLRDVLSRVAKAARRHIEVKDRPSPNFKMCDHGKMADVA